MKSLSRLISYSLNPKPFLYAITTPLRFSSSTMTTPLEDNPVFPSSSMEKQFKTYRSMLTKSKPNMNSFSDATLESAIHMLKYSLYEDQSSIFLHGYLPSPDSSSEMYFSFRHYYDELAEVRYSSPEKYYENYSRWEDERRKTISIVAFLHWLETGNLILDTEFEQKMENFHFEPKDYVLGLTMMANQLPAYVVHQALAGDYETPKKALQVLNDICTLLEAINAQDDKLLSEYFLSVMESIRRVGKMSEDVKVLMPRKDGEMDDEQEELQG